MSLSIKQLEIGAFALHQGLTLGTYSALAWGSATIPAIGSGDAISHTGMRLTGKTKVMDADTIEGAAFQDLPVLMEISGELNVPTICKYDGMDKLHYWGFGYEDGGSSPVTVSAGIYSHLFEIDQHERHVTTYRSNEDTAAGYASTDRKCRLGVFAVKRGPNDHRYQQSICSGMQFTSKAGDFLKATYKGVAYKETRGDYDSANWTFPAWNADIPGSSLCIPHNQLALTLGEAGGTMVSLGVTDLNISVEYPLRIEQDSNSGLYLTEPKMEGKVKVTASISLTTHGADTYLAYRDAFTPKMAMKALFSTGSYEFGFYLPSIKISDSSVSEDGVARNPIT